MEEVDIPVWGIDNFGNEQFMMPGYNYTFPGNEVFEIPLLKRGGQLPKAQSSMIPSKNTTGAPLEKGYTHISSPKYPELDTPEAWTKYIKENQGRLSKW